MPWLPQELLDNIRKVEFIQDEDGRSYCPWCHFYETWEDWAEEKPLYHEENCPRKQLNFIGTQSEMEF